ncbi:hypothetical protein [Streptomyces sp. WAC05374]|uniref:hypothetical protein n=1 Tax=Streptomyces sp. WAC05374 TaxID=2487420 RepID=UPI00135B49D0|nr:hypothetical protein [Streptomyces sp. WAC05374]
MLDDLAFRKLVQGLVSESPAAETKIGQDGGDDALGEPAHRGASPFVTGQGVVKGLELRVAGACVIGEEFVEPLLEGAAGTRSRRAISRSIAVFERTGVPESGGDSRFAHAGTAGPS